MTTSAFSGHVGHCRPLASRRPLALNAVLDPSPRPNASGELP